MPHVDAVECPHCSARIKIKSESILGKKVACPKCSQPFVAKAPATDRARTPASTPPVSKTKTAAPATGSAPIAVACPHCQAKFRLKSAAQLGKKLACPKCGEGFVPKGSKPAVSVAKVQPRAEPEEADDDFLANLSAAAKDSRTADVEESDAGSDDEAAPAPRPSAGKSRKSSKSSSKKRRESSSGGGGFAMPGIIGWLIFGGIGGAVGAGIWIAVGFFTGFEVGWIAWGVGALTGMGVRLAAQANGEDGPAPGITAAGLSIAAVLAGKYFVVHLLVDKLMAGPAGQQAPEAVRQMGQEALKQAVFLSSFTLHDILWFVLAAGSAFKLGSGAEEGE